MEFREQLKYPPVARIALITLNGRNEEKIQFLAEQIKKEVEKRLPEVGETILCGPAPAPLARAETHFRYQILLRTKFITKLSHQLNLMICASGTWYFVSPHVSRWGAERQARRREARMRLVRGTRNPPEYLRVHAVVAFRPLIPALSQGDRDRWLTRSGLQTHCLV